MDRQKIILIFAGAWISAALLTWFVFSRVAGPKTEKTTKVYAAARDLPAGTRIKPRDIKLINVSENSSPRAAISDEKLALDRVVLHPLNQNEAIVTTKLTSGSAAEGIASIIEPGKRAVSVQITDVSSAGGLIQPRSRVDVLFTRTGSMREALTTTILQDVMVIAIGRATEAGQNDPKAARPQNQAATLMVTPDDANKLELARNQGKLSLSLRNPLDNSLNDMPSVTAESLDPDIFQGATRAIRSSMMASTRVPNVRDDKVWSEITGMKEPDSKPKEPAKPKVVIDVYRGDKHIQEIF